MKFSIILTRRISERCNMPYNEFRAWFIKFQVTGFELQDKSRAGVIHKYTTSFLAVRV